MIKRHKATFLFIITAYYALFFYLDKESTKHPYFVAHRIAHAGGAVNGDTYTNSIEALNENIKNSFIYFELDFSFTKDNELVCLHNWGKDFERSFGFNTRDKLTLQEFNALSKEKSKYQKINIETLAKWMIKNRSAKIVTDVKGDNIKALEIIFNTLPDAERRVIPQIYFPEEFEKVKNIGYRNVIWTLYRYRGDNEDVINWVTHFTPPFAITMTKRRAKSNLPLKLARKNIPTYVHTINLISEMSSYKNNNISEIYSDFIHPNVK